MIRKSLPVILILAAIGLFYTFIDPLYKEVKDLRVEEAKFDEALLRSREFTALRDELITRRNAIPEEDLERLRKLLPDTVDNVRLILDLDSIAGGYGMRVGNLGVTVGDSSGTVGGSGTAYGSVRISFTTAAVYETLLAFLSDLERSLRVVDIAELAFQEAQGDLVEYKVTLETYWLR